MCKEVELGNKAICQRFLILIHLSCKGPEKTLNEVDLDCQVFKYKAGGGVLLILELLRLHVVFNELLPIEAGLAWTFVQQDSQAVPGTCPRPWAGEQPVRAASIPPQGSETVPKFQPDATSAPLRGPHKTRLASLH